MGTNRAFVLVDNTSPLLMAFLVGVKKTISIYKDARIFTRSTNPFIDQLFQEVGGVRLLDPSQSVGEVIIRFNPEYVEKVTMPQDNSFATHAYLKKLPPQGVKPYSIEEQGYIGASELFVWGAEDQSIKDLVPPTVQIKGNYTDTMLLLSEVYPTWRGVFAFLLGNSLSIIEMRQLIKILRQFYVSKGVQELEFKESSSIFQAFANAALDYISSESGNMKVIGDGWEYSVVLSDNLPSVTSDSKRKVYKRAFILEVLEFKESTRTDTDRVNNVFDDKQVEPASVNPVTPPNKLSGKTTNTADVSESNEQHNITKMEEPAYESMDSKSVPPTPAQTEHKNKDATNDHTDDPVDELMKEVLDE